MRTIPLFFGILVLAGCSVDEFQAESASQTDDAKSNARLSHNNPKHLTPTQNKVLLLKVDYLTQTFEGGRQMVFTDSPTFNITYNYQEPGDFGSLTLVYSDVGQPIFEGTIIWMGLGQMYYPQSLMPAGSFGTAAALPMPSSDSFLVLDYAQTNQPTPYEAIWDAIKNLQVVSQFRTSNPNGNIRIFLYTPSVGVGNPADWDYYVILKN